eukprot:6210411-Pleurochrysis_carterae.AAC.1
MDCSYDTVSLHNEPNDDVCMRYFVQFETKSKFMRVLSTLMHYARRYSDHGFKGYAHQQELQFSFCIFVSACHTPASASGGESDVITLNLRSHALLLVATTVLDCRCKLHSLYSLIIGMRLDPL